MHICVYPYRKKRKGIFSLAQGPVCVCVCKCVHVSVSEGESRLTVVIMRTNAELYSNQDAYNAVSKRDESYANIYIVAHIFTSTDYLKSLLQQETPEMTAKKMHGQGHGLEFHP